MEKQTGFLGVSNPVWGFIAVLALALVLLAFFVLDIGPNVF